MRTFEEQLCPVEYRGLGLGLDETGARPTICRSGINALRDNIEAIKLGMVQCEAASIGRHPGKAA